MGGGIAVVVAVVVDVVIALAFAVYATLRLSRLGDT